MAFPYDHKGSANRQEVIVLKGQQELSATTSIYTTDINLPYAGWNVGVNLWLTDANTAAKIYVHAYIDHAQTIETGKCYLLQYDVQSPATSITVASSSLDGQAFVFPALGTLGVAGGAGMSSHGYKLYVECDASSGTLDYEIVAQQQT